MKPKASANVVQNILSKLNFVERNALQSYINQQVTLTISKAEAALQEAAEEKEQYLQNLNDKTWNMISTCLEIAIKENHISKQRMDIIFERLTELVKENNDNPALDVEKINKKLKDTILLNKDNFNELVEYAIEGHCKLCSHQHKHCKVYQLYKKYNVPKPTGYKAKCKYGYGR
jgi:uncharacterized protein YllA (UPF0747 family)